jgi:hypothetical protein
VLLLLDTMILEAPADLVTQTLSLREHLIETVENLAQALRG